MTCPKTTRDNQAGDINHVIPFANFSLILLFPNSGILDVLVVVNSSCVGLDRTVRQPWKIWERGKLRLALECISVYMQFLFFFKYGIKKVQCEKI